MARSDDPTTFSQTWQDVPQGYAGADTLTQQPQPTYADPQQGYAPAQPAAADPAYYGQVADPQQSYGEAAYQAAAQPQYAEHGQAETYQQAAVDPYPPLELPAATYDAGVQAEPHAFQTQQPAAEHYATYEQPAAAPAQTYQPVEAYRQAAPQSYQQPEAHPVSYQPVEPVTQQYAQPAYADQPAQGYAPAPEQPQSVVYSDYSAAQPPQQDAYAPQATYAAPAVPLSQHDQFATGEPLAPAGHFNEFSAPTEPSFDTGQQPQGYAPQPQYEHAPQVQDPYAFPQHAATQGGDHAQLGAELHPQTGHPEESILDPGLFAQPESAPQHAGLGGGLDQFGQQPQQYSDQQHQLGHAGLEQQSGYDQRFEQHHQGYDQRFEQPTQGHYDGGLVGDVGAQDQFDGQDMGAAVAPVIADQQMETSRSRRGLIVVGALVAAVGIGGALGFAYKYSNEGGLTASANPPTIKANRTAAKVTPATQSSDLGTRLATNRAASPSKTRLQSREEPLAAQNSGVSLRSSTSGETNRSGSRVTSLQNDNRANVPGVRRVKTLKVNPDGTFAAPSTGSAFGSGDNTISGLTIGSLPSATKPKAKRIVVPKTLQAVTTARKRVATLPKVTSVPQPRPAAARKRVAGLQPVAPSPAAVPTTAGNGLGFVVQVSARRSRIDALAAFADLQQRYTTALSAKQPDIQEVNLGGTRGKWYRVRIGPPGSKNSAYNLCNRLKKSGLKDCLIKAY